MKSESCKQLIRNSSADASKDKQHCVIRKVKVVCKTADVLMLSARLHWGIIIYTKIVASTLCTQQFEIILRKGILKPELNACNLKFSFKSKLSLQNICSAVPFLKILFNPISDVYDAAWNDDSLSASSGIRVRCEEASSFPSLWPRGRHRGRQGAANDITLGRAEASPVELRQFTGALTGTCNRIVGRNLFFF
jgi:hypothetical protein